MRLRFLGPLEASTDDQVTAISSVQLGTLLSVLAVHGRQVVTRETLLSVMWEGRPTPSKNALEAVVMRLRRALDILDGPDGSAVRTMCGGYVLDVDATDVDFHGFRATLDAARNVRYTDQRRALELLETALSVWRGTPFVGTRDTTLLRLERVRLERLKAQAEEQLSEIRLELGDDVAALEDLWRLTEAAPTRERGVELLMVALFRTGQQGSAHHVFHGTRKRLRDELGIDVSPGLQAVYQAVLRHDKVLETADALTLGPAQRQLRPDP
ncbi:BTAD domain-containing putative transcriptional regulator [Cellulomonas sp. JZ18]|uniref:AfsR/SARP family transcriptional regulator n=1 Tax=Cellulomonas sp. JZ18 TaxID=2654191 RepID=UPI0018AF8065|nr:BTAD domain-containing putative transcriptional regulator [Cellulomonas sp. JZ18]